MFEDGVPDVLQARRLKVPTDRVSFASCGAHLTAFLQRVKRLFQVLRGVHHVKPFGTLGIAGP